MSEILDSVKLVFEYKERLKTDNFDIREHRFSLL